MLRFKRKLLLILFLLLFPLPAFSIEEVVEEQGLKVEPHIISFWKTKINSTYALSDFMVYRTKLKENGINIQSSYMIDSFVMNSREKFSKK